MEIDSKHKLSYTYQISKLFTLMAGIFVVSIGLAILLYKEAFYFFSEPFSDLGMVKTWKLGINNTTSRWLFSGGMILNGLLLLKIGSLYRDDSRLHHHKMKSRLAVLGAAGFFVTTVPNDVAPIIHGIGAGVMIASLYFFTLMFFYELRFMFAQWQFILDMNIFQLGTWAYALGFSLGADYKHELQKLCTVVVLFMLNKNYA